MTAPAPSLHEYRHDSLPPRGDAIDLAAVATHGIGRGDFTAVVFSGDGDVFGEVPGYGTWLSGRKFALPDPRVPASRDLARDPRWPLPVWSGPVRPTPGVCFVFSDAEHPGVEAMRARGGEEFEHFVILPRLTLAAIRQWRAQRFLRALDTHEQNRERKRATTPIALLGYGDQGRALASTLLDLGVPPSRLLVSDDNTARRMAARTAGFQIGSLDDVRAANAAIIATPLAPPARFPLLLAEAARDGRPALDNSLPWDDRPEFGWSGPIARTSGVARANTLRGFTLVAADHGLPLPLLMSQHAELSIGGLLVPALRSNLHVFCDATAHRIQPLQAAPADPLAHRLTTIRRAWLGLDGQSNHQDAALSILSARDFLADLAPDAARATIPARHRAEMGTTPFERTVVRTATGRSLASPYMAAAEQAALGVLARHACGIGVGGHPIVEIGSALGGSALLMCAATQGAAPADGPTLHSIDPEEATRPGMRAALQAAGFGPRLRQIVRRSSKAIDELRDLTARVGLVFIDGLHTRDASMTDFTLYAPLVRAGGLILFHDCDPRHAGVFRTVSEVAATRRDFTLRALIDTLAVFERNAP